MRCVHEFTGERQGERGRVSERASEREIVWGGWMCVREKGPCSLHWFALDQGWNNLALGGSVSEYEDEGSHEVRVPPSGDTTPCRMTGVT